MGSIINFFQEAKVELSRVNWPGRKEIARYTVLVVIISLGLAIFLGGLDFLFSFLVEKYLIS